MTSESADAPAMRASLLRELMSPDRPVSRRSFVVAASGLAAAAAVDCVRPASASAPTELLLHVGTFTEAGRVTGVYLFRFDVSSGALRRIGAIDAGPNPGFLAITPDRRTLVAANEVDTWEGAPTGAVSAFTVDPNSGTLTLRGRRSSRGPGPAYVSLDRSGRFALVANYAGGSVAVLPVAADGVLGEATAFVQHSGTGPNKERQTAPHAHCIITDPTNRFALATDLGADRIVVYRFDDRAGTLAPAATPYAAARPGAGPRHLAFHPNGHFLYVTNELDLTLGAYAWDASAGLLTSIGTVPAVDGLVPGANTMADVHLAPSGRFLYATVRGDDSVAVHAIDQSTGRLTPVQRIPTGGQWPRNFGLDPSGRFLLVANQHSNDIVVFRVDEATGRLTPAGQRAEVPAPVCIRFAGGVT